MTREITDHALTRMPITNWLSF